VAVGCIEPQFYREMLDLLQLDDTEMPDQLDRNRWPELRSVLADTFARRTRDDWAKVFRGSDACVTPVLSMTEALEHEHLKSRRTHDAVDGRVQPAPAPRFGLAPATTPGPPSCRAADDVLADWIGATHN
jgi:alpha-methylacyl-CoA racemase